MMAYLQPTVSVLLPLRATVSVIDTPAKSQPAASSTSIKRTVVLSDGFSTSTVFVIVTMNWATASVRQAHGKR